MPITNTQELYEEVFRILDIIWASGDRITAGYVALATEGTTSGEIFPKLRAALKTSSGSRSVRELGLSDRVAECIRVLDDALAAHGRNRYRG